VTTFGGADVAEATGVLAVFPRVSPSVLTGAFEGLTIGTGTGVGLVGFMSGLAARR
jgi:hypothetical protein